MKHYSPSWRTPSGATSFGAFASGATVWLPILFVLLSFSGANAQSSIIRRNALSDARVDWHLAGIAESQGRWDDALKYYDRVSRDVVPVPLAIREWYRATASYGKALCSSRLGNCDDVREALASAARRHFWNFDLLQSDSVLLQKCGGYWLDSLKSYWEQVRAAEQENWVAQTSIVIYPRQDTNHSVLPVIIALHGGNACYTEFAEYWRSVADAHHLIVVVPPGSARESETTNSWGYDMAPVEKEILEIVGAIRQNRIGDTSRIYLAGYSQGAQATLEIGIRHPKIFKGLLSICGFMNEYPDSLALSGVSGSGLRIFAIEPELENASFKVSMKHVSELMNRAAVQYYEAIVPDMIHEMPLDFTHQFDQAWNWLTQPANSNGAAASLHRRRHTSE